MLWFLLQGPEPVHVHHVSLRSRSGRWKAEDAAMSRILPYMRDVREFGYSQSVYDVRKQGKAYDVTLVSRECAAACKRLNLVPAVYARGGAAHDETCSGIEFRRAKAKEAWLKAWAPKQAPPTVFPVQHKTRAELWHMLPEKIRKHVWSCRKPQFDMKAEAYWPCGKCRTCREFDAEGVAHPSVRKAMTHAAQ
jgi:hypothetical protein